MLYQDFYDKYTIKKKKPEKAKIMHADDYPKDYRQPDDPVKAAHNPSSNKLRPASVKACELDWIFTQKEGDIFLKDLIDQ